MADGSVGAAVNEDDSGIGTGGKKRNPGLRAAMDATTHQVDSLAERSLVSRPHSPPSGYRRLSPPVPPRDAPLLRPGNPARIRAGRPAAHDTGGTPGGKSLFFTICYQFRTPSGQVCAIFRRPPMQRSGRSTGRESVLPLIHRTKYKRPGSCPGVFPLRTRLRRRQWA